MSGHTPWNQIKFKKDDGEAAERRAIAEAQAYNMQKRKTK